MDHQAGVKVAVEHGSGAEIGPVAQRQVRRRVTAGGVPGYAPLCRIRGDPVVASLGAMLPIGRVSVVGSFNNWTPGLDELADIADGTRGVTVAMPYGQETVFRYVGPGDGWFDEPEAEEITDRGSILHAIGPRTP